MSDEPRPCLGCFFDNDARHAMDCPRRRRALWMKHTRRFGAILGTLCAVGSALWARLRGRHG